MPSSTLAGKIRVAEEGGFGEGGWSSMIVIRRSLW